MCTLMNICYIKCLSAEFQVCNNSFLPPSVSNKPWFKLSYLQLLGELLGNVLQ